MKKIVIIGGCAAGPKAAAKSKRLNPDNIIELYTKEDMISYSACGLPYFIGGIVPNVNDLSVRTPEQFEKSGISVFLNHTCTKILPDEKKVIFNNEKEVFYDELILCIGSNPIIPDIKNSDLKNVFNLKVIKDGINIKNAAIVSKSVLLIGAGYIAIELMEAFINNNLKIYVVEKHSSIMPFLDSDMSDIVYQNILKKAGDSIEFILNDEVEV